MPGAYKYLPMNRYAVMGNSNPVMGVAAIPAIPAAAILEEDGSALLEEDGTNLLEEG